MSSRDEYGLPRRELGAGFLALMLVGCLYALASGLVDGDFGYGAMGVALAMGAVVAVGGSWLEEERGEMFASSLKSRLERHEKAQQRRERVKFSVSCVTAYVLISFVPERYGEIGIAFLLGGVAATLAIFVLDRWVVLPRQVAEQRPTSD